MREIPLRKVEVTPPGIIEPQMFVYSDMMLLVLTKKEPGQGMDFAEMERALSVSKAIRTAVEAGRETALLETADFDYLKGRLLGFRNWQIADEAIAEMIRSVRDAPEVDLNKQSV